MGLFHLLFKPKPDAPREKMEAPLPAHPDVPAASAELDTPPAAPPVFLHPKGYAAGADNAFAPAHPAAARPPERKAAMAPQDKPAGEVMLTLGDVLPRIPTHFLRTGMHDLRRELRFDINALTPDIARGRASVRLSLIAALCPDLFHSAIGELEDVEIRLPLQKLVEQIGRIRTEARARGHSWETVNAWRGGTGRSQSPIVETPASARAPAAAELEIHLSVAALLPGIPHELIVRPLPPVDERLRITLPFAPIERQLAGGTVEVSSHRFVSVLPPELRPYFAAREGVNVPLPIEEVFQNLPNVTNATPASAADSSMTRPEPASIPLANATSVPAAPVDAPPREPVAPAPEVAPVQSANVLPEEIETPPVTLNVEAAPAGGFVPSVRLPPVRLFAPPPPPVAKLLTAPAAADTAARAASLQAASPAEAPAPARREEPHPVTPFTAAAPVHPTPATPLQTAASIRQTGNPEPAPTQPPPARPQLLQPPILFGQTNTAGAPLAPQPVVPLPIFTPVPPPEASAQRASALQLSIPQFAPAPVPPPERALPALPLARFDHDNLQALFMTEEVLDLQKISRLAAQFPGVQACVIATRETAVTGGVLPEGFDIAALLGLAPRVGEAAGLLPIGALKHFTLYGEHHSVSFFERRGLCLCAVHRARSFVPGVREKLVALADELAR